MLLRLALTVPLAGVLPACDSADSAQGRDGPSLEDQSQEDAGESSDAMSEPIDAGQGPRDAGRHVVDSGAEDAGTTEVRKLAKPPSYLGSLNNGQACSTQYPTIGFEPVAQRGARHPLFLYFVGTAFSADDPAARHDHEAALAVTEAMARRGFVALSVSYDNGALAWLSDHKHQLACLFSSQEGLLAKACDLPQVDCELGIGTWGHSQGGYVAVMARNHEPRVRAAWATGYGGDASSMLSKQRLRVVNGEADTSNGTASVLNGITGLSTAECPEPDRCLRKDGSGWIIVRKKDLTDAAGSSADHCWFYKASCGASDFRLEPSWTDPRSDRPYALEANADWVAATARRTQ